MNFDRTTIEDPPKGLRLRGPKGLGAKARVDREQRVIRNYAVITGGVEALGHGEFIDDVFLEQVAKAGQLSRNGVKARFTHPGLSSDGLGTQLGRARNFRHVGDKVVADLHFGEMSKNAPGKGDIGAYVMGLAEEAPEDFGTSIVFQPDIGAMSKFVSENSDEDGMFKSPDKRNARNFPHSRLAELFASDVVDEPAANPGGFYAAGNAIPEQAEGVIAYAMGLTDEMPEGLAGAPHPERVRRFLRDFLERHGLAIRKDEGEEGGEKIKRSSRFSKPGKDPSLAAAPSSLASSGGSVGEGDGGGEADPALGEAGEGREAIPVTIGGATGEARRAIEVEPGEEGTLSAEGEEKSAPTKESLNAMLAALRAEGEAQGIVGKEEGEAADLCGGGVGLGATSAPGGTMTVRFGEKTWTKKIFAGGEVKALPAAGGKELRGRAGPGERATTGKARGTTPSKKKEGRTMPEAIDMQAVKELRDRFENEDDINELRSISAMAAQQAADINEEAKARESGKGRMDDDEKEMFKQYADIAEGAAERANELEQREYDAYSETLVAQTGTSGGSSSGGSKSRVPQIVMGADRSQAKDFSMAKFFRGIARGNWAGADRERRASYATQIPQDSVLGGNFVPEVVAREIYGLVRSASGLDRLATLKTMTALIQTYVKVTSGTTHTWIGPGSGTDIPESDLKTGTVELRKRVCAALVPVDNQLLDNATPEFEQELRSDLIQGGAAAAFLAFFFGSGNGPEPMGLVNQSGLNAQSSVTLANLTLKNVKASKRYVRKNDHTCDWLAMTTDIYDKLEEEETTTGAPKLAGSHTEAGQERISGVPVVLSNHLRFPKSGDAAKIFAGEKASVLAGFGNRMSIDIDRSIGFKQNMTWFRLLMEFDCNIYDATAFDSRPVTALDA